MSLGKKMLLKVVMIKFKIPSMELLTKTSKKNQSLIATTATPSIL